MFKEVNTSHTLIVAGLLPLPPHQAREASPSSYIYSYILLSRIFLKTFFILNVVGCGFLGLLSSRLGLSSDGLVLVDDGELNGLLVPPQLMLEGCRPLQLVQPVFLGFDEELKYTFSNILFNI